MKVSATQPPSHFALSGNQLIGGDQDNVSANNSQGESVEKEGGSNEEESDKDIADDNKQGTSPRKERANKGSQAKSSYTAKVCAGTQPAHERKLASQRSVPGPLAQNGGNIVHPIKQKTLAAEYSATSTLTEPNPIQKQPE